MKMGISSLEINEAGQVIINNPELAEKIKEFKAINPEISPDLNLICSGDSSTTLTRSKPGLNLICSGTPTTEDIQAKPDLNIIC